MSTSAQQVSGFQQIAGPLIINVNPGETKSFSWGLLAGINETSILKIYADGNGSELLSIPQTFKLAPGRTNYITGNVTIPFNHPTNTTLTPIIHSTISENDTTNSGGNAVNVELSKLLTITVGSNNTQSRPINANNFTTNPSIQQPALIGLGLRTKGTINSVITTPKTQWIATGNWSLNVNDGKATFFETKMTWNNVNGTNSHSHEFQNLRVSSPVLLNQSEKSISIKGLLDVGTNQRIIWKDVPSIININGKKTISISVNDNMTNHHFASQPILGVVNSFLICSDVPGPNMEVLPPCSEPNLVTAPSTDSSGESMTGIQSTMPSQPPSIPESQPQQFGQDTQAQSSQSLTTGVQSTMPSQPPSIPESQPQQFGQDTQDQRSQSFTTPNMQKDNTTIQSVLPTEPMGSCDKISIKSANASGFETDPKDYNPPGEAIDTNMKTWWANKGLPSWLQVNLDRPAVLCTVEIAWNKGNERTYDFVIGTSDNGNVFTDVYNGSSSGKTQAYEKYDIPNSPSNVKSVKLSFTGSSSKSGWVSIKEISVTGR